MSQDPQTQAPKFKFKENARLKRFEPWQEKVLQAAFNEDPKPSLAKRIALAAGFGCEERRINTYFINRRSKERIAKAKNALPPEEAPKSSPPLPPAIATRSEVEFVPQRYTVPPEQHVPAPLPFLFTLFAAQEPFPLLEGSAIEEAESLAQEPPLKRRKVEEAELPVGDERQPKVSSI